MADNVAQGLILGIGALVFAGVISVAFIRSLLSFRYWLGWLVLAGMLFAMSVIVGVVDPSWSVLGLRFLDLGFIAFQFIVLLVAVQLSISISGHRRMLTAVAQECAELRYRVEELERTASIPTSTSGSGSDPTSSGSSPSD